MGTDFDEFGIAKRFGGFDLGNGIDKGFSTCTLLAFSASTTDGTCHPKSFFGFLARAEAATRNAVFPRSRRSITNRFPPLDGGRENARTGAAGCSSSMTKRPIFGRGLPKR